MKRLSVCALVAVLLVAALAGSRAAEAAEKAKEPPPTVYWMSVATQNQTIPGMEQQMTGFSGMMGRAMGMPESMSRMRLPNTINTAACHSIAIYISFKGNTGYQRSVSCPPGVFSLTMQAYVLRINCTPSRKLPTTMGVMRIHLGGSSTEGVTIFV